MQATSYRLIQYTLINFEFTYSDSGTLISILLCSKFICKPQLIEVNLENYLHYMHRYTRICKALNSDIFSPLICSI
jgi:hypothetical protein